MYNGPALPWTEILLLLVLWMMFPRTVFAEPMVAPHDNHPHMTLPTSPAPPDMQLHMTVTFKIRNRDEWDRVTKEHRDPSSEESHHVWTPEEQHQRFGAKPADFQMVEQWLLANGFSIILERYGKGSVDSILCTGTVAQAEKAFGIKIVKSGDLFGNTSDPVVLVRIAAVMQNIAGLDNAGGVTPQSFRVPLEKSPTGSIEIDKLFQPDITTSLTPANLYSIIPCIMRRRCKAQA